MRHSLSWLTGHLLKWYPSCHGVLQLVGSGQLQCVLVWSSVLAILFTFAVQSCCGELLGQCQQQLTITPLITLFRHFGLVLLVRLRSV